MFYNLAVCHLLFFFFFYRIKVIPSTFKASNTPHTGGNSQAGYLSRSRSASRPEMLPHPSCQFWLSLSPREAVWCGGALPSVRSATTLLKDYTCFLFPIWSRPILLWNTKQINYKEKLACVLLPFISSIESTDRIILSDCYKSFQKHTVFLYFTGDGVITFSSTVICNSLFNIVALKLPICIVYQLDVLV